MLPCSAADFAEDLSVMNAKERKKEKRRSEREALQTTMATGKAARDAAARIAQGVVNARSFGRNANELCVFVVRLLSRRRPTQLPETPA